MCVDYVELDISAIGLNRCAVATRGKVRCDLADLRAFPMKLECDALNALLAALSCRKGASHDYSSTKDDRGHAGAESLTAYAGVVSPAGFAVRTLLSNVAECFDPRTHPDLSDLSHEREEAGAQFDTFGCCGASVPLQGYPQEGLGLWRRHPASQKTTEAPRRLEP